MEAGGHLSTTTGLRAPLSLTAHRAMRHGCPDAAARPCCGEAAAPRTLELRWDGAPRSPTVPTHQSVGAWRAWVSGSPRHCCLRSLECILKHQYSAASYQQSRHTRGFINRQAFSRAGTPEDLSINWAPEHVCLLCVCVCVCVWVCVVGLSAELAHQRIY